MNKEQLNAAQNAMTAWLSHPNELGKKPFQIDCTKEFDLHNLHYYIFRFKEKMLGEWKLGVCGGYENDSLEHCGHVFSNFNKYNDKNALEESIEIVEKIRAYWMNKAIEIEKSNKQDDLQTKIKKNTTFRTQDEIPVEDIETQFIKNENRFYLNVGQIDCPTGKIVVADPLAYLPSSKFCPLLAESVPSGTYSVEVSVCRQEEIGVRMCTAKLKIKDSKVVVYKKTRATKETVVELKNGDVLEGFPVDAGMVCFCDAQIANEYRTFLDNWYSENPDKNHYDDYFAKYFEESYQKTPTYQREGGDFIEWANPETGNKFVMIASGLGDGFYNSYYGYDCNDEICEIIIPMVNPEIFGC